MPYVQHRLKKSKAVPVIFLLFMLGGCTSSSSLQQQLNEGLISVNHEDVFQPDTYHEYYSYYRGHGVGIYSSGAVSSVLNSDGHRFIMNLNIDGIITPTDTVKLPEYLENLTTAAEKEDTYSDAANTIHYYRVVVKEAGRKDLLVFTGDNVVFMALCDESSAVQLAKTMLTIARSLKVDEKKLRLAYIADEPVNYYGRKIKLFENMTPENGMISEIIEENDGQSSE